ncbi:MAG: lamin tail domain-containing protein [Phycisphaerae bacterium]|nr:lamin tail domain-containing protein [Phycisphaerae bacterium]
MKYRVFQSFSFGSVWVCAVLGMMLMLAEALAQVPVINEFLAYNDSALPLEGGERLDEDGDASDWIELFNPTTEVIDLQGWSLTDDAGDLTRWALPQVDLWPGHFLVIFASGKDRMNPSTGLHTNFRLSRVQGFLALVHPDGQTMASSFEYPGQLRNVSYGRVEVAPSLGEILVSEGAQATVGLPLMAMQDDTWTEPDYNDSAWLSTTTGVGYGYDDVLGFEIEFLRYLSPGLFCRIPFEVSDPAEYVRLLLRMKYDDGFVAFLNGLPVASANAPGPDQLAWDSLALSRHDNAMALMYEEFVLPQAGLDALRTGHNVLAIHQLNVTVDSAGLLSLPELWAQRSEDIEQDLPKQGYMVRPTPGSVNAAGSLDFVRDVTFSAAHGFYEDAFALTLTTITPSAQIRYTLDGSTPTLTHGQIYAGPIIMDHTTVVRAVAFKQDYLTSNVRTQTYLFAADVAVQSPKGEAPAPDWPDRNVNGQVLDYGMDPDVVNNPRWADLMEEALLSIPTLSLVTDLENLFDPRTGIYVNPGNDGLAWERRTSVELIDPDGTPGFDQDAGLRIRGAFSRSKSNPKHSFRLFFRSDYGAGKLAYPLFGSEGGREFDKVDLRTSQNYAWAFEGSTQNTFLRDVFSRDVQRDMGRPYTRSRYYHLYLNGQYWGLYQTEERADADFAESYLGGRAQDYDVIKNDSSSSRALQATDGTMEAYRRLYNAAKAGFASKQAYMAIQGLRPDGTPDPAGERLLDPENLMDYMICTYYTGDPDAPVSCWGHFSNNVFAIYNRVTSQGFTWYRHDAEHSLGANGGLNEGRLLTDPTDRMIGSQWQHFNPAWLHVRLCDNPDYLAQFTDRVAGYFTNDGLLTASHNIARWMARAEQIDLAVIAESARWGDAKRSSPLTRDDWQAQTDSMVNTYFPNRTDIVINQMRSVAMFPEPALVSFNQSGGGIVPGFQLLMSQSNGTPGSIYYTLDGSDPRLPDGTVHPRAAVFTDETTEAAVIMRGATWKYLDNGSNQGTAWREADFDDSTWLAGRAPLGYGDGDETTVVGYGPNAGSKYPTTYFRSTFNVANPASLTELTLGLVRDDGAVIYVNGVEATPRINMPGGDIDYLTWASGSGVPVGGADESTMYPYEIDPDLLVPGTNVMAVEIHQANAGSSDISFDLELTGLMASAASVPIILDRTTIVNARVYSGAQWGALARTRFTLGLDALVLNEIMASNLTTLEDPGEAGEYPDWIEIYNGSAFTLDLDGMFLTDDLSNLTQWQIAPGTRLGAGQTMIFFADSDPLQGPNHMSFKLSSQGETLALVDTDGVTILDSADFGIQTDDISYGRFPDGMDPWDYQTNPTPGLPNMASP